VFFINTKAQLSQTNMGFGELKEMMFGLYRNQRSENHSAVIQH